MQDLYNCDSYPEQSLRALQEKEIHYRKRGYLRHIVGIDAYEPLDKKSFRLESNALKFLMQFSKVYFNKL